MPEGGSQPIKLKPISPEDSGLTPFNLQPIGQEQTPLEQLISTHTTQQFNQPTTTSTLAQRGLSTAGKILDVANALGFGTTNILEDLTRTGNFTPFQSFLKGVTLQEKPVGSDVLTNLGFNPTTTAGKIAKGATGLAIDVALDPTTYVGIGGLTKLGKARQTVKGLKRSGKFVQQGIKFVNAADAPVSKTLLKNVNKLNKFLGKLPEEKALKVINTADTILTKQDEAREGFRAILRVGRGAGRPVIKGEKVYKGLGEFTEISKRTPVLKQLRNTFIGEDKLGLHTVKGIKLEGLNNLAKVKKLTHSKESVQKLNKFADRMRKLNLPESEIRKITGMSEFIDRPDKFEELFGMSIDSLSPDKRKLITDWRTFTEETTDAVRREGIALSGWREHYKSQISNIEKERIKLADTIAKTTDITKRKELQSKLLENFNELENTKELLELSPAYTIHILSEDAIRQLAKRRGGAGGAKFLRDPVNSTMLARKFKAKNGVPLGIQEINEKIKFGKSSNLFQNQPILKSESFFESVVGRNKKMLDEYSRLYNEGNTKGLENWYKKNADKIADAFETDPIRAMKTLIHKTSQQVEDLTYLKGVTGLFGVGLKKGQTKSGYRTVNLSFFKDDKVMPSSIRKVLKENEFNKIQFPEEIADILERRVSLYNKRGAFTGADYFHQATNLVKAYLTVPRIGFHGRNSISSGYMHWSVGGGLSSIKKSGKLLNDIRTNNVKALNKSIGAFTGKEVYRDALRLGLIDESFRFDIHKIDDIGILDKKGRIRKSLGNLNPFSTHNVALKQGRRVGQQVENFWRMATYIDGLEKGLSRADAAKRVFKAHYNYSDITNIEKGFLSQLIPFYRWSRHNIPAQVMRLMENPSKTLGTIKAIRNTQSILTDNEYVDELLIPQFLKDEMGMQVTRSQGGDIGFVAFGSFLPIGDLAELEPTPKAISEYLLKSLNPMIKVFVELLLDKDVFFKQPIQGYKGRVRKFLGVNVPTRMDKVLRTVAPLNEFNKFVNNSKKSFFQAGVDFTLGARVYTRELRKEAEFQKRKQQEEIGRIKSDIRKAVRDKDTKEVLRLRTILKEKNLFIRDLNYALKRSTNIK